MIVIPTNNNYLQWKPKLYLAERELGVVKEYNYFGLTIDSGLGFNVHVTKEAPKARRRVKILRCLTGKELGQSLETQRVV